MSNLDRSFNQYCQPISKTRGRDLTIDQPNASLVARILGNRYSGIEPAPLSDSLPGPGLDEKLQRRPGRETLCYLAREAATGEMFRIEVRTSDEGMSDLSRLMAVTASLLEHPHIARLRVIEKPPGAVTLICEYPAEAETLRQRLEREGWLELRDAKSIAGQIASALDYAHRLGILHLSLQPEQILLTSQGRTIVTGFGLPATTAFAWAHVERARSSRPLYLSPEQLRCSEAVDQRSDIYALGAILYEMLSDRLPYDSFDEEEIRRRKRVQPLALRLVAPSEAAEMEPIVMQMLAPDPELRPSAASGMADALPRTAPSSSQSHSSMARSSMPRFAAESLPRYAADAALEPPLDAPVPELPVNRIETESVRQESAIESATEQQPSRVLAQQAPADIEGTRGNSRPFLWRLTQSLGSSRRRLGLLRASRRLSLPLVGMLSASSLLALQLMKERPGPPAPAPGIVASTQARPTPADPNAVEMTIPFESSPAASFDRAIRESKGTDDAEREKGEKESAPEAQTQARTEAQTEAQNEGQTEAHHQPAPLPQTTPSGSPLAASSIDLSVGPPAGPARLDAPAPPPKTEPKPETAPGQATRSPEQAGSRGEMAAGARTGRESEKPGEEIVYGEAERRVTPHYPASARNIGLSGKVTVAVEVDERGRVVSARALSGPMLLRSEAEIAARGWRFAPSTRDGVPVRVTRTLTFNFRN